MNFYTNNNKTLWGGALKGVLVGVLMSYSFAAIEASQVPTFTNMADASEYLSKIGALKDGPLTPKDEEDIERKAKEIAAQKASQATTETNSVVQKFGKGHLSTKQPTQAQLSVARPVSGQGRTVAEPAANREQRGKVKKQEVEDILRRESKNRQESFNSDSDVDRLSQLAVQMETTLKNDLPLYKEWFQHYSSSYKLPKLDPKKPYTFAIYCYSEALTELENLIIEKAKLPTKLFSSTGAPMPPIYWVGDSSKSRFERMFQQYKVDATLRLRPIHNAKNFPIFSSQEMQVKGSSDVRVLNKFLTDNGFTIQLQPFGYPDAVGAVAIMKIKWQWEQEAYATSLKVEGKEYPAVSIDGSVFGQQDKSGKINDPVVSLLGAWKKVSLNRNGRIEHVQIRDKIWICYPDAPRADFDLHKYVNDIKAKIERTRVKCPTAQTPCHVTFPMVDIHDNPDISWLMYMKAFPTNKQITQALAETFFGMDEKGGFAKAAVALACATMCCTFDRQPKIQITIDKPFIVWVDREVYIDGAYQISEEPIFVAYVPEQNWKRPSACDF